MSQIMWEIEKIKNNPRTLVRIGFNDGFGAASPETDVITGFMIDETFSLTGSSTYNPNLVEKMTGVASSANDAAGLFGKGIGAMASGAGSAIASGVQNAAFLAGYGDKLLAQTIKTWDGSEPPPLNVGLLFIATKPTDTIEENVANLVSRCYPDHVGWKSAKLLKAPMGYTPVTLLAEDTLTTVQGTCLLEIGQWFRAEGLLIDAVDFQVSKECLENGSPLYATGTVSFSTYREISYKEYKKFFIKVGAT